MFLFLAACGGTIAPNGNDASPPDVDAAGDAIDEPSYAACFDNGVLSYALKACESDSDCTIQQEQTDCCGTIEYVGVSSSFVSEFSQCEAAWVAHFPGCGCASGQTKTEDGTLTHPGQDAGTPQVHCTDFTMNGGVCLTFTPQ